jgi:hypothetical protein
MLNDCDVQHFQKPLLVGLTQFIGLAFYVPFSNWHEEVKDVIILRKIFLISLTATATFLCLGFGLQYLPITSSIIIRVCISHPRVTPLPPPNLTALLLLLPPRRWAGRPSSPCSAAT